MCRRIVVVFILAALFLNGVEVSRADDEKESFYMVVFASDGKQREARLSHTFATFVHVRQAAPGATDPQQELEMVRANTGATKPVSGLGERAEYTHGVESNLPPHAIMLYVVKGNTLITVGLNGLEDDSLALEKARGVAQKILDKL